MLTLAFIDPVALRLGPITVHWYGIIFVLAILSAAYSTHRLAPMRGLDQNLLPDISVVVVISGIVGARLYEVFVLQWDNIGYYLSHPLDILATWKGGLAIHGGVIGALLAGGIYVVYVKKQSFWRWADAIGPGLILAQGVGRWGNFFNQEAYGSEAPAWVVNAMPGWLREGMTIEGKIMHPTFLYESVWNILVFGILYAVYRRKPPIGVVFSLYLILYNVGRWAIESIREDSTILEGGMRVAQIMAVVQIVVGLGFLVYHLRRKVHESTSA
ncbi:MAG TPA: prolipoprotein diacylglyceryl transferase [Symbiobacteriaceae bacterium]|nr:prolipoprotein diacylglyceryl transferase [Symbiobacteriaceae bacterium]